MGITEVDVEKAALLHDIGKLIQRAEANHRQTHAAIGEEFLRRYFTGARKEILHGVAYHHYKELGGAGLPPDDISYIVYEADNLASAADRRAREENAAGDNKKLLDSMPKAPCTAFLMCLTNERRAPIRPIPFGAWDIRRSILTLCQHSGCRHQRKNTGKWKKYWGIPLEKRVRQR